MKKLFLLFIFVFVALNLSAKDFYITKNGLPAATVIISENAKETDRYAAEEFVRYIREISGAELSVNTAETNGNCIFIGEDFISLIQKKPKTFTDDTVLIDCNEKRLVLTGGKTKGTVYSVYTFLEEYLGVKYIIPEEDYIPKNPTVSLKKISYEYTPVFISRDPLFLSTGFVKKSKFAIKHRCNGQSCYQFNNLIPRMMIVGFAHTVDQLMNPDVYGKDHPEWFAERNGTRILKKGFTQPCLSNEAMIEEMTKNLLETIEKEPHEKIFSVTQSDNDNYCECEKCKILSEKYGHSGALLTVINRIAGKVKEKYPDKLIDTFAYHYTLTPPKGGIVPADNVIIRLCPWADQSKNILHPSNKETYNQLKGWSSISKQLYLWDYCGDFFNYLLPCPNTQVYQKNMQVYADNKVIACLTLGDYHNASAWFLPYKTYIVSKLSWNPYLDLEKEKEIFMNAYYGPAGKIMLEYLNLTEKLMETKDVMLHRRYESINYFTAEELTESFEYLNKALDSCKNSEKYYNRVWCDYLCLSAGTLYANPQIKNKVKNAGVMRIDSIGKLCKELTFFGSEHGITHDRESHLLTESHFAMTENIHKLPKPEICRNLNDNDWYEMTPEDLDNQSHREDISKVVEDPKALCGKARWISDDKNWPTQLPLPFIFKNEKARSCDMYVTYRTEPGTKPGKAYEIGFYSFGEKKYYGRFDINNTDTPDGEYRTVRACTFDMENTSPDITMWICGMSDRDLDKGLYIERIFFVYNY